jgi:hypothetical protein
MPAEDMIAKLLELLGRESDVESCSRVENERNEPTDVIGVSMTDGDMFFITVEYE